jgi:hypothetical protein
VLGIPAAALRERGGLDGTAVGPLRSRAAGLPGASGAKIVIVGLMRPPLWTTRWCSKHSSRMPSGVVTSRQSRTVSERQYSFPTQREWLYQASFAPTVSSSVVCV